VIMVLIENHKDDLPEPASILRIKIVCRTLHNGVHKRWGKYHHWGTLFMWEQSWPYESHSWSVRQSSPFKTNIAMMSCHDTMHWLQSALDSGV
jgi:hypothetical protein